MSNSLLLFEFDLPGYITGILSFAAALAGFLVCYVYLRSGVETKKAEGLQSLLSIEEKRAAKYEALYSEESKQHLELKVDYDSLSNEYGQLSELFAKKSLVLEAFTGEYGGVAAAIEHLAMEGKLTLPKRMLLIDNIHITSGGRKHDPSK